MKKLIICFDMDNVICKSPTNLYSKSTPHKKNIEMINLLKKRGHYIKIFTSRFMGRNKENSVLAKKQGFKITKSQLKKWKVSYDELIFGKPSYDLFVDDKSLFFKKNWAVNLKKKINRKKL